MESKNRLNKNCDVCQKAKHGRDKFPASEPKVLATFELIHCDLWRPYRAISSCAASYFSTIIDDFSHGA